MISLKGIIEKLNDNIQLNWNTEMSNKDCIQSNLESEKIKALGQNNFRQLM